MSNWIVKSHQCQYIVAVMLFTLNLCRFVHVEVILCHQSQRNQLFILMTRFCATVFQQLKRCPILCTKRLCRSSTWCFQCVLFLLWSLRSIPGVTRWPFALEKQQLQKPFLNPGPANPVQLPRERETACGSCMNWLQSRKGLDPGNGKTHTTRRTYSYLSKGSQWGKQTATVLKNTLWLSDLEISWPSRDAHRDQISQPEVSEVIGTNRPPPPHRHIKSPLHVTNTPKKELHLYILFVFLEMFAGKLVKNDGWIQRAGMAAGLTIGVLQNMACLSSRESLHTCPCVLCDQADCIR